MAARMTDEKSEMVFVLDMHRFQLSRNFDLKAIQAIGSALSSSYAYRMGPCIVVDLPWMAETLWQAVKVLNSARVQEKFKFVRLQEAQDMIAEFSNTMLKDSIYEAFAVNRGINGA